MSDYPFVQARWYTKGRFGQRPIWVVVHDMETAEASDTAERLARAASTWSRKASWHVGVDNDSEVRSVRDADTAYAAKGANTRGLHIEHAGRASQTAEQWRDHFSDAMLARSAKIAHLWHREFDIPVRRLTVDQVRRYEPGFTDHATVEKAFPSSGHWDPGPNFPWAYYLDLVRAVPLLGPTPGVIMIDCVHALVCPIDGGLQKLQYDGGVFNARGCTHFHGSYVGLRNTAGRHPDEGAMRKFNTFVRRGTTGYILIATSGEEYEFVDA